MARDADREARLAEALRANLRRRKEQLRAAERNGEKSGAHGAEDQRPES